MKTVESASADVFLTSQNIVLTKLLESCKKVLNERDRKLEKFAHQNSHKLRAPVARIQGLINLLGYSTIEQDSKIVMEHLRAAAKELDSVTREINRNLECDDLYEDCFKRAIA